MQVLSVNVGSVRFVEWKGEQVPTAIWKTAVQGKQPVTGVHLGPDEQADLENHGGYYKAVYAYPFEHYPYWSTQQGNIELPFGSFGENLTVTGLREEDVRSGDIFRVGTAELMATTPRIPCFKLGIRLEDQSIVERLLKSGRSGIYFAIVREGEVEAGDKIERVESASTAPTILELNTLNWSKERDAAVIRRAANLESIPPGWRDRFSRLAAAL